MTKVISRNLSTSLARLREGLGERWYETKAWMTFLTALQQRDQNAAAGELGPGMVSHISRLLGKYKPEGLRSVHEGASEFRTITPTPEEEAFFFNANRMRPGKRWVRYFAEHDRKERERREAEAAAQAALEPEHEVSQLDRIEGKLDRLLAAWEVK